MTQETTLTPATVATEQLLLDAPQVAALLGIGISTLYKLNSGGRLPEPLRLGACVRWRRAEVADWIAAGCPARGRWTWREGRR